MGSVQALMAAQVISGLTQVAGGITNMISTGREANQQEQQAKIALQQSQIDAATKTRQINMFRASQAQAYSDSGVTLEGTPAIVMEQTRQQGQQEVNAILRQGQAQADLLRAKAGQTRNAGRMGLIGSIAGAGAQGLQGYVLSQKLGLYKKPGTTVSPLDPYAIYNPATGP